MTNVTEFKKETSNTIKPFVFWQNNQFRIVLSRDTRSFTTAYEGMELDSLENPMWKKVSKDVVINAMYRDALNKRGCE